MCKKKKIERKTEKKTQKNWNMIFVSIAHRTLALYIILGLSVVDVRKIEIRTRTHIYNSLPQINRFIILKVYLNCMSKVYTCLNRWILTTQIISTNKYNTETKQLIQFWMINMFKAGRHSDDVQFSWTNDKQKHQNKATKIQLQTTN